MSSFVVNGLSLDKNVVDKLVISDVKGLTYDPNEKVLTIHQRELCCTDMFGAIKLAKKIDPQVKKIVTLSGSEPDIDYYLNPDLQSWERFDTRWYLKQHYSVSA